MAQTTVASTPPLCCGPVSSKTQPPVRPQLAPAASPCTITLNVTVATCATFPATQLYRPEWSRRSPPTGATCSIDTLPLETTVIKELGRSGGVVQVNVGVGKLSALQTMSTTGVPPVTAIRSGDTASSSKSEMEVQVKAQCRSPHVCTACCVPIESFLTSLTHTTHDRRPAAGPWAHLQAATPTATDHAHSY